jgi:hypothetical protein
MNDEDENQRMQSHSLSENKRLSSDGSSEEEQIDHVAKKAKLQGQLRRFFIF